jgi:bifunctional oligoribonuclease and PAP phosphatase NrnA
MTDTGSFRYSNTTAKAMSVASELLASGADHGLLIERVYESHPPERLRLLARVLQTLEFFHGGRVASLDVTRAMFQETGAGEDLTEGFVNIPRAVGGVEVALLFSEISGDEYRVSLRSRGKVNVGKVAARFQGGGHPEAAGCTLHGSWNTVRQTMLKAVEEALL